MTKNNITRRVLVIRGLIAGSIIPISQTISVGRAESPTLDPNDLTAKPLGRLQSALPYRPAAPITLS